ncbi:MAG: TIGR03759 family integrating conjugative element protein [Parahaliea sp.]
MAASTSTPALAQKVPATGSRASSSLERGTQDAATDEHHAKDWGLQPAEWARYRQLMQGPLGIHSPNLDPLTALGIEANTAEERRRYAELQVQAEARRVEKILAYQWAYDAAWQRLYPTLRRVNLTGKKIADSGNLSSLRLAVFVKEDCPPCEWRVRQLLAKDVTFDLYMVGSREEDARIRQWATRVGIDPSKVLARHITLNHDSGRWLSIGVAGDLPAVVREVNGQWLRL